MDEPVPEQTRPLCRMGISAVGVHTETHTVRALRKNVDFAWDILVFQAFRIPQAMDDIHRFIRKSMEHKRGRRIVRDVQLRRYIRTEVHLCFRQEIF